MNARARADLPLPATRRPPRPALPRASTGPRGATTRAQLMAQAARIFAVKGYAAASTREICQAAGANVAAIHYYFGDKEALYRAVLVEPIRAFTSQVEGFDDPGLPFDRAIARLFEPFVALALDDRPDAPHVERLHLREALEPSPVFREIVAGLIAPQHRALVGLLARHCGLARPDVAIHQLAFAIVAMANDYCLSRGYMKMLAPEIVSRAHAQPQILERLVGFAGALLAHEKARRAAAADRPRRQRREAAGGDAR